MSNETANDDHLPPPAAPAEKSGKPSRDAHPVPSGTGPRWGERVLFLAAGILAGFTAAYLYLDKFPGPAAHVHDQAEADPHAGIPGFGQGGMPGDQPAMPPPNMALEQKIADLRAELEKKPGDYTLLVQLGNTAFDVENWPLAVESYEKALSLKRTDVNVLTDLGVSYRNQGKADKALALFDESLVVEPGHWQALFNKVIVIGIDQGNPGKAREILSELKKLREKNPEIPPLERLEEALGSSAKK